MRQETSLHNMSYCHVQQIICNFSFHPIKSKPLLRVRKTKVVTPFHRLMECVDGFLG